MNRFTEVWDRHPGTYDVVHDTEVEGRKDGDFVAKRIAVHHELNAGQVEALALREIDKDPYASLTVFTAHGDHAHIGWFNCNNVHELLDPQ